MEEIWKDIKGFEDKYQVSNLGRIKSLKDKNGKYREKILKQCITQKGYLSIYLSLESKKYTYTIHRLVAQTFIPNTENKPQVNHIDGNKSNNIVSNLEWCTNSENQKHAWEHGLSVNKGQKPVGAYDINDNLILSFNSIEEAAKYFNKKRVNIDNALHHKQNQKTAYGYVWKFLN